MDSFDFYTDENFIINAEKNIYKVINTTTDTSRDLLSFIHDINDIFEIVYREFFNYHKYENSKFYITNWYYPLLNDFRRTIMTKINFNTATIEIGKEQKLYLDFLGKVLKNKYDHNWYYVYRINSEIYHTLITRIGEGIEYLNLDLHMFAPEIVRDLKTIRIEFRDWYIDNLPFDDKIMQFEMIRDLLIQQKKELEDDLFILTANNTLKPMSPRQKLHSLYHIDNKDIIDRIDTISNILTKDNRLVNIVGTYKTHVISQEDEVRLLHTKYIDSIISSKYDRSVIYWYGIKDNELYFICKSTNVEKLHYVLVLLDDKCIDYLRAVSDIPKPKIKIINITFPNVGNNIDYHLEQITEGLSINENGDIKISINPKKSYMDEYAEAHRILIENYKNKNYEAMKQNVAFMFLLISIIERDDRYKKRDKDIVKARAFAINDFKTYLAYIQKEDPSFNFERYYKDSEFDKYVVNIPKETILGIRNLLKSILM
jgi:hypothetical protein